MANEPAGAEPRNLLARLIIQLKSLKQVGFFVTLSSLSSRVRVILMGCQAVVYTELPSNLAGDQHLINMTSYCNISARLFCGWQGGAIRGVSDVYCVAKNSRNPSIAKKHSTYSLCAVCLVTQRGGGESPPRVTSWPSPIGVSLDEFGRL